MGIGQSDKEPGKELPMQGEQQQWRLPGGEEVRQLSYLIESRCDHSPVKMEASGLESYKPAINIVNNIASETKISLKILGFIKNQSMFAEWN